MPDKPFPERDKPHLFTIYGLFCIAPFCNNQPLVQIKMQKRLQKAVDFSFCVFGCNIFADLHSSCDFYTSFYQKIAFVFVFPVVCLFAASPKLYKNRIFISSANIFTEAKPKIIKKPPIFLQSKRSKKRRASLY